MNWMGSASNIRGSGPACSVDGGPQTLDPRENVLYATGAGVCNVEVTDGNGAVIFTTKAYVARVASETCCSGYDGDSVVIPPEAVPPIVVPPHDGGDRD